MPIMPRAPLVVGVLGTATAVLATIDRVLDPAPWTPESGALLVAGGWLLTITGLAGFLVARGRWSRVVMGVMAGAWVGVAAAAPLDTWSVATTVVGAATIGAMVGPWPSRWLRHLPAADGPPIAGVVALLALAATPFVHALSSSGGTENGDWIVAIWSVLLALWVSQGSPLGLATLRFGHGALVVAVAVATGIVTAIPLLVVTAVAMAGAWHPTMTIAVDRTVATDQPVPTPPELVAPELLEAAGYDDRGAPKELA